MAASVVLLILVMGGATAPAAQAYQWSPADLDAVTEWGYKGSQVEPAPSVNCGSVCDDLWLSEHRPMPNQPSSKALHAEMRMFRARTGLMTAFRTLGSRLIPAVGAFTVGWGIGSELRGQLFGMEYEGVNKTATAVFDRLYAVSAGDVMAMSGEVAILAPRDGFMLTSDTTQSFWWKQSCNPQPDPAMPPGAVAVTASMPATQCLVSQHPDVYETITPVLAVAFLPAEFMAPTLNGTTGADAFGGNVPDPGQQAVRAAVESELGDGCGTRYVVLCDELDGVLHGSHARAVPQILPGELWEAYAARAEAAGFVPVREIAPFPETRPEKPAKTVITTSPAPGTELDEGEEVEVVTNPDQDDMPIAIPEPLPGEKASAYRERLQQLGLLGAIVTLTETALNPDVGPEEVARVQPRPTPQGSSNIADYVPPGADVTVYENPPTAPPVDGGGAGCDTPNVRSPNFGPLMVDFSNVFPFGIFAWLDDSLGGLVGGGVAPEIDIPMPGDIEPLHLTLEPFSDLMANWIHPAILLLSFISLVYLLASTAAGLGRPSEE